jgi:hypothetical protein
MHAKRIPLWVEDAARVLLALLIVAVLAVLFVAVDREAQRTDCGIAAAQGVDTAGVSGCER